MKRTPHRILQLRDLIENLSRLDPEKKDGERFSEAPIAPTRRIRRGLQSGLMA